jgi:hypothetical protein
MVIKIRKAENFAKFKESYLCVAGMGIELNQKEKK